MSEVGKKIGGFFKSYRLEADLTIAEVAAYLELSSDRDLLRYEEGDLKIPLYHVFALSNLYNVSPDQVTELYYELAIDGSRDLEANLPAKESEAMPAATGSFDSKPSRVKPAR